MHAQAAGVWTDPRGDSRGRGLVPAGSVRTGGGKATTARGPARRDTNKQGRAAHSGPSACAGGAIHGHNQESRPIPRHKHQHQGQRQEQTRGRGRGTEASATAQSCPWTPGWRLARHPFPASLTFLSGRCGCASQHKGFSHHYQRHIPQDSDIFRCDKH